MLQFAIFDKHIKLIFNIKEQNDCNIISQNIQEKKQSWTIKIDEKDES